jgi:hypothetical protein
MRHAGMRQIVSGFSTPIQNAQGKTQLSFSSPLSMITEELCFNDEQDATAYLMCNGYAVNNSIV